MQVAVYPGTFDPLHIGHLAILRHLVSCGRFDAVYLIVSPQNPFKDESRLLTATRRTTAAKKAVARYPELACVSVDDIEFGLPSPNYTLKTLNCLQEREPGNSFTLIIGGDNLDAFRKWKAYDSILLNYGVLVFPREGADCETVRADLMDENPLYRIDIAGTSLVNVSSTQIRSALANGEDTSDILM